MKPKKKRQNLLRNLHRRKKIFFIYDVIVKQNLKKRPANHYLQGGKKDSTNNISDMYENDVGKGGSIWL
jgi:hypothetical protein